MQSLTVAIHRGRKCGIILQTQKRTDHPKCHPQSRERHEWGAAAGVDNLAVGYTELTPPQGIVTIGQSVWLEGVGLGLTLWGGQFEEEVTRLWLRWCDRDGRVIPTGAEGREIERQRADAVRQRVERLAERLRAMGINPDEV